MMTNETKSKVLQFPTVTEQDKQTKTLIRQNELIKEQAERIRKLLESKEKDFLNAHLSTPSFIKTLTDLSDDVMTYQTMQEKKIFLKQ